MSCRVHFPSSTSWPSRIYTSPGVWKRLLHCNRIWWKIPPIKVVQNLHRHGGIFPPSIQGWKNSTMPHPPFLVEFSHLLADGGKIPTSKVEFFPPYASRWKNSTISKRWKIPPTKVWWNFSTINKEVEKYNHGISTFFGGISHYLQAGGTILPYQGKHLLIIGVHSVNTVEWCAHQSHCLINNQIPIKSLYRPKT